MSIAANNTASVLETVEDALATLLPEADKLRDLSSAGIATLNAAMTALRDLRDITSKIDTVLGALAPQIEPSLNDNVLPGSRNLQAAVG